MGLAVYWLTLARMPKSIMNYLRRAIFNFLWGSSAGSYRAHLVDWHSLSKPYGLGGWNIKHLDWFSTALRFKSLWLVLNGNDIWSHIIKFKYLKGMTVAPCQIFPGSWHILHMEWLCQSHVMDHMSPWLEGW